MAVLQPTKKPPLTKENASPSVFLLMLAGVSLCATFLGVLDIIPTPPAFTRISVFINIACFLGLVLMIGRRINTIRKDWMQGRAGALLHTRLAVFFSLIAGVPAFLVAGFAAFTLDQGLDSWFSTRTKAIMDNTTAVANAYIAEQHQSLRRDTLTMASELTRQAALYQQAPAQFQNFMTAQAAHRSIPQAVLLRDDGTIIATASSPDVSVSLHLPARDAFARARTGAPIVLADGKHAQVRTLMRLQGFDNLYLYATRLIAPDIARHLAQADRAGRDYAGFASNRFERQIQFASFYLVLVVFILLLAVWVGFAVADRLSRPIGKLIRATQRLGEGDLQARVEIDGAHSDDEVYQLSETFNTMADRLSSQQAALLTAHHDLDKRAEFTQMVLHGVSSGVVGVDANGVINHVNAAACALYDAPADALIGKPVLERMPEFEPLLIAARKSKSKNIRPISVTKIDAKNNPHTLLASASVSQVATDKDNNATLVLTFDDVTNLLSAQRNAAWADIARRIAHEIKNPLTPIQLSAERLQSKYGDLDFVDKDIFAQCTRTIINQVEDIGRMVDEFANFARMPRAVIKSFDVADVIAQAVFLQSTAHPDIEYHYDKPDELRMDGDARQLSQALTNVLKNAAEAMRESGKDDKRIAIKAEVQDDEVRITVSDTGAGWPETNRYALLEPYHTSRAHGTGLGLSIVKKVVEDHGGTLHLEDTDWGDAHTGGASLIFVLPRTHEDRAD